MFFRRLIWFLLWLLTCSVVLNAMANAGVKIANEKGRVDLSGATTNEIRGVILNDPLSIKILILDSCRLTTLPNELEGLLNLKHISLNANPNLDLRSAIDILQQLPNLEFLNLSHNKLTILPEGLARLSELTGLRLSYNKLEPNQAATLLMQLPKLRWLWIDNNNMEEFSPFFFSFPKLRFLYAYDNQISRLSVPLNPTNKLWVLHLGSNLFEELPITLIKIKNLRMTMFNKNKITRIPNEFMTERYSISALILDDNPLIEKERKKANSCFKKMMMYSNTSYD